MSMEGSSDFLFSRSVVPGGVCFDLMRSFEMRMMNILFSATSFIEILTNV